MIWNQGYGLYPSAQAIYAGFGGFQPFDYWAGQGSTPIIPDYLTATGSSSHPNPLLGTLTAVTADGGAFSAPNRTTSLTVAVTGMTSRIIRP